MLNIAYPRFSGRPRSLIRQLNRLVRNTVNRNIGPFLNCPKPLTCEYSCDYTMHLLDQRMVSVELVFREYSGSAHNFATTYVSFNYMCQPQVRRLDLAAVFGKPVDYKIISDLSKSRLYRSNIDTDQRFVESGAGPNAKNFEDFFLDKSGITFRFDECQVAPCAMGAPTIHFTYGELKPLFSTRSPVFKYVQTSQGPPIDMSERARLDELTAAREKKR